MDEHEPTRHQKESAGKNNSRMVVTSSEAGDDTRSKNNKKQITQLLSKKDALLERQALREARQKKEFLKERILRDKVDALSRKLNLLSQQYSTMFNRHRLITWHCKEL